MLEDDLKHFPEGIGKEIEDFSTECVFNQRRYIFTYRDRKVQYGRCSHCNTTQSLPGVRHNETTVCPGCGSLVMAKSNGMGKKYLIDQAYFVYYAKSLIDPDVIVARGFHAVRDYSKNCYDVQTKIEVTALYVFRPGGSTMYYRSSWYWLHRNEFSLYNFVERKSVFSLYPHMSNVVFAKVVSLESIEKAVVGTPFQYSCWESYENRNDLVDFFSLFSKYPSIEYLTKMGFENLVESKLRKENTFSTIHWKGKTPMAVLRLGKKEIREIRESGETIDPIDLRIMQLAKKRKENIGIDVVKGVSSFAYAEWKDFVAMLQRIPMRKFYHYVSKQFANQPKQKNSLFGTEYQVCTHWRDYIDDCIALEMDLSDESILYPRNLYNAHQGTIAKRKVMADEIAARKIAARAKDLIKKYCFESNDLKIVVPSSAAAIISEGKALHHCVGTYAKKHADGQTTILFVRKVDKPNRPFYTMEIDERRHMIIQCRGLRNANQTDEVKEFVRAFAEARLKKKTKTA